ncbi:MAG: sugar-binding protein [Armatimonadota bacterium]
MWDNTANSGNITDEVLADIQRVAEYGLDVVAGMGAISGVVVDQNGKPVPLVNVKLTASFGSATAITNDAGEFSIVAAAGTVKAFALGKTILSSETVDADVKVGETTRVTIKVNAVEPYTYHIAKAKTPIVIDGNITDAEWGDAETMVLNKQEQVSAGTWEGPDDLSGVWRVKFDDQYLYIAVDITDDMPRINAYTDGNVWQGDGIETYVGLDAYDPKRTAYNESRNYQWTIGVGPDIAWKIFRPAAGDRLPPDIPDTEGNLVVKDHHAGQKPGYVIEARMPWSGFPDVDTTLIPPKEGTPAAITAGINDTDTPDSTSRETAMLFEKTTEAWHDPSVWVRAMWGAPAKPAVVKGDLNGDGKLAIADATIALRIAVGMETATADQLAAGDINGNGKIDIPDVTRILRSAVGLDTL